VRCLIDFNDWVADKVLCARCSAGVDLYLFTKDAQEFGSADPRVTLLQFEACVPEQLGDTFQIPAIQQLCVSV
jgi:hypothetical protein